MIRTFHPFSVKPSERQRHAAMWTEIPHRGNLALSIATQENRQPEHEERLHRSRLQLAARQGGIPKAEERSALGWLGLSDEVAIHGTNGMRGNIVSSGTISGGLSEVKVVALTRKRSGDYSQNPVEIATFMRI
jgi:hypothetical protein